MAELETARPEHDEIRVRVGAVAVALNDRFATITASLRDTLATRIEELQGDAAIIDLMESSIGGNVENILHALRHGIPVELIEPPSAAYEYARRLAQRGIPVNALVRAYRLGQQKLLEVAYAECVAQHPDEPTLASTYQQIVTVTFDYIDWMSQEVATIYESERERWLTERNTARFDRVDDLIRGSATDVDEAEDIIGYRLRVPHLGAVFWVHETGAQQDQLRRFDRAAAAVAEELGSGRSPLLIPRDRASAWAWIPMPQDVDPDLSALRPLLEHDGPPVPMVAFGTVRSGLDGFRRTHEQAVQAQRVAMIRDDPTQTVTGFAEPGLRVAAHLALGVDEARRWVQETLGELAGEGEQHERLRETLWMYFLHDTSYTVTAEAMVMHKNSVKYRVASAEKLIGRGIGDDRQAIELAITACHWLGRAVLAPDLPAEP